MFTSWDLHFVLIVVAVANYAQSATYLSEKPDFLTPCSAQEANYKACLASNVQVMFRQWKDGVPGLKTSNPIDPLRLKRVEISQDANNPTSLNIELTNLVISGASNIIIKDVEVNAKDSTLIISFHAPLLTATSDYKLSGQVSQLSLNGNDKTDFSAENLLIKFLMKYKRRSENNFTFLDVENVQTTIENIGSFQIYLHNLFNGQPELTESVNGVLNENWRNIYETIKPAIVQTFDAVLGDRFTRVLGYVPIDFFVTQTS